MCYNITRTREAEPESRRRERKMKGTEKKITCADEFASSGKIYYILRDLDGYGSEYPICVDRAEAERLVREWECGDFDEIWCEASEEDIAKYGRYDTDEN